MAKNGQINHVKHQLLAQSEQKLKELEYASQLELEEQAS